MHVCMHVYMLFRPAFWVCAYRGLWEGKRRCVCADDRLLTARPMLACAQVVKHSKTLWEVDFLQLELRTP